MKTIYLFFVFNFFVLLAISQTWLPLGIGTNNEVLSLHSYNGSLCVGGRFISAGGVAASKIAKWDGTSWSALGVGMDTGLGSGFIKVLLDYNSELYSGGSFSTADGFPASNIAKWNGISQSAVGSGMNAGGVSALAVYNAELYAGGSFTSPAQYIAKWNGTAWSAVGTGMNNFGFVHSLTVYNGELYAGGCFTDAGGVPANRIAKWNGSTWSAVGTGMNSCVWSLAVYNSELYAGGNFYTAGGNSAKSIAKWNGTNWSSVGGGMDSMSFVYALEVYNGELYAGGSFKTAGGMPANYIAKWNGTVWSAIGTGMDSTVNALGTYNAELYAGGIFTMAGGNSANYIAKLDTTTGIIENSLNNNFIIYPNPCTNKIFINNLGNNKANITLFDIVGKQATEMFNNRHNITEIDLSELDEGIYFMKIQTVNGELTKKILKSR